MNAAAVPDPECSPGFEEALRELQQIVTELEDGSISLEQSLSRFEEGIRLLRGCYQVLERAEQKIELLTGLDAQGNPVTTPFDATATAEGSAGGAAKPGRRRSPAKKAPAAAEAPEPAAPAEPAADEEDKRREDFLF
jgi:exodeoxyribonuclease VII small subunit